MACPCCDNDEWEYQLEIDEDRDLDAVEYECMYCGCQYWVETIVQTTIVKEGCIEDEEEDE